MGGDKDKKKKSEKEKAPKKKAKDKDKGDEHFEKDMAVGEAKTQFRKSLDDGTSKIATKPNGEIKISRSIHSTRSTLVVDSNATTTTEINTSGDNAGGASRKAAKDGKERRVSKEMKNFIKNVETKYEIIESDLKKRYNHFDGVFWRDLMQNYFQGHSNWPPKTRFGFFWTKGYYKDWSDQRKGKFNFWTDHKEYQAVQDTGKVFEDEIEKEEHMTMLKVKAARELGLKDADDWESYDSISDDGKHVKKYRRKSMKVHQPELYNSHAARKAHREKQRKLEKKQANKEKRESQIHIKEPLFIQDLASLGPSVNAMNENDIAKFLVEDKDAKPAKAKKAKKEKKHHDKPSDESSTTPSPDTQEGEPGTQEVKKPKKPKKEKKKAEGKGTAEDASETATAGTAEKKEKKKKKEKNKPTGSDAPAK